MSRYNHHRRDESHREIVAALEAMGCSVRDLSQVGDKGCDLDVAFMGQMWPVECKAGKETLSAEQREYYESWRGPAVVVLHNREEAIAWVLDQRQHITRDMFGQLPVNARPTK